MAFEPRNQKEEYILDMILNSYSSAGKVKSIIPVNLDWLALAGQINPTHNLFFGRLVVDSKFFDVNKYLSFFATVSVPYQVMYTALFERVMMYIAGSVTNNAAVTSPVVVSDFQDILFDDIVFPPTNAASSASIGDINAVGGGAQYYSISQLIPSSNAVFVEELFVGPLATNSQFIYAPNLLYFTGYKINMER